MPRNFRIARDRGAIPGGVAKTAANADPHYVFDLWVEVWRKKIAKGDVIVSSGSKYRHRASPFNVQATHNPGNKMTTKKLRLL